MKFKIEKQFLHLILGERHYTFANTCDGFEKMVELAFHHKGFA